MCKLELRIKREGQEDYVIKDGYSWLWYTVHTISAAYIGYVVGSWIF